MILRRFFIPFLVTLLPATAMAQFGAPMMVTAGAGTRAGTITGEFVSCGSSCSFSTPGITGTVIGTLSATISAGTPSIAWALSASVGGCNSTNGANNSSFQLSGNSLQVLTNGLAAGTYSVCITASGPYRNSPQHLALTITGSLLAAGFIVDIASVGGTCNDSYTNVQGLSTTTPFCHIARAQTAMQATATKVTYVRAGAYDARTFRVGGGHCGASSGGVAVAMTSADNGETLRYYPPDGVNTAKIDGFQTTPGVNDLSAVDQGICVEGINISIIGIHTTRFVGGNIVSLGNGNNQITDNEADLSVGGPGAISVSNGNTASHNYSHDNYGQGIGFDSNGAETIQYNVVYNNCSSTWSDCGSIYSYTGTGASTIFRNYVHDNNFFTTGKFGSAWYQDGCGDNKNFNENIASGVFYNGGFFNGGSNLTSHGEIVDLGPQAQGAQAIVTSQSYNQPGCGTLSGNVFDQAIVIAKSSNAGSGYNSNFGPFPTPISSGPNMYHNYTGPDSPQINSTGFDGNDPNPQNQNPKFLTCPGGGVDSWSYALDPTSPAFNSPVNHPAQTANDRGIAWGHPGYWGPVGFTIPHTGTPPSYVPTC